MRQKLLGEEHPDVAASYSNLGTLYYQEGDQAKAVTHIRKALQIVEATLGPDHPNTKTFRDGLEQIQGQP
ncbi:MAG: tetratricopeptide repeat protein [Acaryochloridaceae cyanobacterium SU_2_1]|nr:tetratricopeptide repeat protein [Acaryochloridaceae cyanobacterium SU_2_1]NJM95431.1 tetratricopeptide repeat protein [Acaryochloridaceae cyanobacterium CSU_5_19]